MFLDYPARPRVHFVIIMRRTSPFITFAGLELARYFALVYAVGSIAGASPSASQLLRVSTAPNALFAAAFLFLGLDRDKYAVYKPLLLLGKGIALFSGGIALPRLLGSGTMAPSNAAYAMIGVVAWDAVSTAALAFIRRTPPDASAPNAPAGAPAGGNEPEPVEID